MVNEKMLYGIQGMYLKKAGGRKRKTAWMFQFIFAADRGSELLHFSCSFYLNPLGSLNFNFNFIALSFSGQASIIKF